MDSIYLRAAAIAAAFAVLPAFAAKDKLEIKELQEPEVAKPATSPIGAGPLRRAAP
jgi:hypothetical protein